MISCDVDDIGDDSHADTVQETDAVVEKTASQSCDCERGLAKVVDDGCTELEAGEGEGKEEAPLEKRKEGKAGDSNLLLNKEEDGEEDEGEEDEENEQEVVDASLLHQFRSLSFAALLRWVQSPHTSTDSWP